MASSDVAPIISLTEAQAYVRLETGDEEALLAGLIRTASTLCETFLNQAVIARPFAEAVTGTGEWQALRSTPVRALTSVRAGSQLLPADRYALDIDDCDTGLVMLPTGLRCVVEGSVGLALDENEVPEPIRQGVVRLTSHLFSHRDDSAYAEPPAIVTALWRPYRRLVLT